MSKKFQERLTAVNTQINALTTLATNDQVAFDSYMTARRVLNVAIIELVFGATINGNKIKFNESMPSMRELSMVHDAFDAFFHAVEEPLMEKFQQQLVGDEFGEDSDVESGTMPNIAGVYGDIPKFSKIHVNDVKASIVGGSGSYMFPIVSIMFTPDQLLEMAALAEDTRKKIRTQQVIIIGGITLAVAAAATATGICIYNHNKKKAALADADTADLDDVAGDAYDDEDVPEVDLDDVV